MISKICKNLITKSLNTKMTKFNSQLFEQAQIANSTGHYSHAISYYQQYLDNKQSTSDPQKVYTSYKFMADAFLKMNNIELSYTHYSQALEEFSKLTLKDTKEEINLLNKVAQTCYDQSQALEYIEKSLSLLKSSNKDNALYIEALRVKAQIFERMGLNKDVINICALILTESDSSTSVDYKYALKKRLLIQSLESFSEVSKELDQIVIQEHQSNFIDSPDVIPLYYQISLKLWKKKEYFRSFQYVQRALQLAELLRGSTHPDFYQCLDLIGQHLVKQGRLYEAQFYFQRALNCVIQGKGPEHEAVVPYQKTLADLYVQSGKYQLAQELYEAAMKIQQKYLAHNSPAILDTNYKITMAEYKQMKNITQTKQNLEWMVGQFSKRNPVKNDKLKSQIIQELAKLNIELNNLDEAQRLYQEFLVLEDNLDLILDAYLDLGYIEMMRKDFEKANQIFERSKILVQDSTHPKFKKIAEQQILVKSMI